MREYKMRVEFYDVDSLNVVWHGNYVKFLEVARCEFLREIGFDYVAMKDLNLAYPVAKMDFKFISPLFFGNEFCVRIRLKSIDGFLRFDYEIYRIGEANISGFYADLGQNLPGKIAIASTAQVCFDLENKITLYDAPEILKNATKGRIWQ